MKRRRLFPARPASAGPFSRRAALAALAVGAAFVSGCATQSKYWFERGHLDARASDMVLANGPYKMQFQGKVYAWIDGDDHDESHYWTPELRERVAAFFHVPESSLTFSDLVWYVHEGQKKKRGRDYQAARFNGPEEHPGATFILAPQVQENAGPLLFDPIRQLWPDVFAGDKRRLVRFRYFMIWKKVGDHPDEPGKKSTSDCETTVYVVGENGMPIRKATALVLPDATVAALAVPGTERKVAWGTKTDIRVGGGTREMTRPPYELRDEIPYEVGTLLVQCLNDMTEDELRASPLE